jgi:NTE family protein
MKVCLSLSGGGSNGIVQVGYCKYFHEKGVEFEIITGTSTGALQGAMYAQEKYPELLEIWKSIRNHKDIYRHHLPFSFLQGFFRKSLYTAAPLRKKIEQYVDVDKLIGAYQRFVSVSTNLTLGEKFYVDSTEFHRDRIKDFIYASAAFPLAFEPVFDRGSYFWDGGLMEPIPVKAAVNRCPDADYYIIGLTNPIRSKFKSSFPNNLAGAGLRAVETMFEEIWQNDVDKGMKYWVDGRFIILAPPEPPFPSSLEWYPELYDDRIAMGYDIAKKALEGII